MKNCFPSEMKIVFAPDWFLTSDILIDVFSFVILLLFFTFAFRSYKLSRKKRILYIGVGFLLIALAELSNILTKIPLYYQTQVISNIGTAIISYDIVKTVDIFYYIGFFFERILMLLGFYIMYKLPLERVSGEFFLNIYLIVIISLMGQSYYYVYHLTALILLVFLVNKYYKIYRKDGVANTGILVMAFVLLGLSQTVFLFSKLNYIYVSGQLMQLASYIILLVLIVKIVKDGKKKKPSGDYPRHA